MTTDGVPLSREQQKEMEAALPRQWGAAADGVDDMSEGESEESEEEEEEEVEKTEQELRAETLAALNRAQNAFGTAKKKRQLMKKKEVAVGSNVRDMAGLTSTIQAKEEDLGKGPEGKCCVFVFFLEGLWGVFVEEKVLVCAGFICIFQDQNPREPTKQFFLLNFPKQ
jgi:hypothetical protein